MPETLACKFCGSDRGFREFGTATCEEASIKDLVGPPVRIEVGARVVCPDGLRGVVAAVDEHARRLTVEGWHEEFTFGEVTELAHA